jgi:hypothetical protein
MNTLQASNVSSNPKYYRANFGLSDAFYHIPFTISSILQMGVMLPPFPGLPPLLVAFPLVVLPMGWTKSLSFFCAFMETMCNLTNTDLR